ncbi:hypothetical protein HanRHA438_Chr01g0033581 [Helianthus annuus]|nr:hypothetical protein HanRHA438_Chr01g0033581 [Helianthus annuus]
MFVCLPDGRVWVLCDSSDVGDDGDNIYRERERGVCTCIYTIVLGY